MRAPTPLPRHLSPRGFRVGDALGIDVSAGRLRGRDLDRRVWGVRAVGVEEGLRRRCGLIAARIPDACFSHTTAAALQGIPLPIRFKDESRIHLSVRAPGRAPHAKGIRGHSMRLDTAELLLIDGLPQTSPARTWLALGAQLTLGELVAAGDFLIHWRLPLATPEELATAVDRHAGGRGSALARRALGLLDDRAESAPESELRVIIHLAGLPKPRVNHVLVDAETGKQLRADLAFVEYRTILEYQGDYHRNRSQWRADMTRRTRLESQGWYVMELNADDLRQPAELGARIRAVLVSRGLR